MAETRQVLENMYNKLDNFLKTETVIGTPIEFDSIKVIPIISASFGLGGGYGEENDKDSGGGGGGGGVGCKITPNAVLIIKEDEVEMLPVKSKGSLDKLIEKAPELISQLDNTKKDSKEENEKEKEEE